MIRDIYFLIFKADAIIFLPDWEQSKGARIEMKVAKLFRKHIIDYDEFSKQIIKNELNNNKNK
jgi:hypothetical protein